MFPEGPFLNAKASDSRQMIKIASIKIADLVIIICILEKRFLEQLRQLKAVVYSRVLKLVITTGWVGTN